MCSAQEYRKAKDTYGAARELIDESQPPSRNRLEMRRHSGIQEDAP